MAHGQCVGQEHRKGMALEVKMTHVRGFWRTFFMITPPVIQLPFGKQKNLWETVTNCK